MQLSSSDGTNKTIDDMKKAWNLLHSSYLRIAEINEGSYRNGQEPIQFNATTCEALDGWMKSIEEATENLKRVIYKKEG